MGGGTSRRENAYCYVKPFDNAGDDVVLLGARDNSEQAYNLCTIHDDVLVDILLFCTVPEIIALRYACKRLVRLTKAPGFLKDAWTQLKMTPGFGEVGVERIHKKASPLPLLYRLRSLRRTGPRVLERTLRFRGNGEVATALGVLGNRLVVACDDPIEVELWNTGTWKLEVTLQSEHTGCIHALAAVGCHGLVSGAEDCTLRVWNILEERRCCEHVITEHTGAITCLKTMTESEQLLSSSADRTIRVWNTTNWQCVAILRGHSDAVTSIVNVRNTLLVSSSEDGSLRIWKSSFGGREGVSCVGARSWTCERTLLVDTTPDGGANLSALVVLGGKLVCRAITQDYSSCIHIYDPQRSWSRESSWPIAVTACGVWASCFKNYEV